MIKAVVDTNILVSALLSPSGSPARILDLVLNEKIIMYYDSRIMAEYQEVLTRPKFGFDAKSISHVINFIIHAGISIIPVPIIDIFNDEDDKMFYEVAKTAGAYLITGNTRHFPDDPIIITPQKFLYDVLSLHS
jgi:uncharacterized protein